MRGNFSSYICLSLKKRSVCPLYLYCRYLEDNFLVQSGDFCIDEYKIRFCKEVYILPLPQSRYFQKLCAIEEVAVQPNMMADFAF